MTSEASVDQGRLSRCFWIVLLLCTVVGGGLRLYQINGASLWIDEVWSVRDALELHTMRPTRGPGYLPMTLVLRAAGFKYPDIRIDDVGSWREAGLDLWHIRLGPAILGILSIPVLGWSVRRAWGTKVAIAFVLLLCFAPWHIYWSQLGRYYTLKFILLGLSLSLYFYGTRQQRPGSVGIGIALAYAAFLVHPPSILIGLVFAADLAVSWLRKDPIRLGKTGWVVGVLVPVAAFATMKVESLFVGMNMDKFVGSSPDLGQSGPLVLANAVYMLGLPLVVFASAVWWTLIRSQEARMRQTGWYLFFAAAVPIVVFTVFGFLGKFTHVRYTFECLLGVLLLASFGLAYLYEALAKTRGILIAASPALVLIASMALALASYYSQGHHNHRRWVDAFALVESLRKDGERVVAPRHEVGQYYLGDNSIRKPPGVLHRFDMYAEGETLWIVDTGTTAVKTRRPIYADHADLVESFPIQVWQPFTELRVYRYTPRPEEVWRAEKAEMDAASQVNKQTDLQDNP